MQDKELGWPAKECILQLSEELLKVEDCEFTVGDILDQPHNT